MKLETAKLCEDFCCLPQVRANLPPGVDGWGISLQGLMSMVVVGGFVIAGTFYWMNRKVVPLIEKRAPTKKKKSKMSVGESFTFLLKSRYIRDLATLVSSCIRAAARKFEHSQLQF